MDQVLEYVKLFGDATVTIIVVVMILRGSLVPRIYLTDVTRDRDLWREAYQAQLEVTAEVRRQNGELLETAKLAEHLLTSFKEKSGQAS